MLKAKEAAVLFERDDALCTRLEEQLLELGGNLNAAECRFLIVFEEFERNKGWAVDGVRSPAHWLN